MTLSYAARLVCLCFAVFFVVHLALGVVVSLLAPAAMRIAERIRPHVAARFLLALRIVPLVSALLVVIGICAPSYLWHEPQKGDEEVGWIFLSAALLGMGLWFSSIVRTIGAALRSARYVRACLSTGKSIQLAGEAVCEIPADLPFLGLAGITRPRLIVSRQLILALKREELEVALRHERAHRVSCDNLKRLVLFLAPGLLPYGWGFGELDRGWARFAERAADDRAVGGNAERALSLAAALVRVARGGALPEATFLLSALVSDRHELASRIDRLLHDVPQRTVSEPVVHALAAVAFAITVVFFLAAILDPSTHPFAHSLIEELIHL